MPRLVKGGKWAYGWVIVGTEGAIRIPPEAWHEYGFQAGRKAVFLPGSQASGGFGLSTPERLANGFEQIGAGRLRTIGYGVLGDESVVLPAEIGVQAGDRLLVVRGSRYGLAFVARGHIWQEAQKHSRSLPVFAAGQRK